MTKREKLIERFKTNPKNVRYEELESLLLYLGFRQRQNGTSHVVFTHADYPAIRLTVPVRKPYIKPIYVQQALEILQTLEDQVE